MIDKYRVGLYMFGVAAVIGGAILALLQVPLWWALLFEAPLILAVVYYYRRHGGHS